jgi:replication-associated recombination protein RarA
MNLSEKFRPSNWQEVIGQPKAIETIQRLKTSSGIGGRAFWLAGKSGQGKTSIANLIAKEVAEDFYITEVCTESLTVSKLEDIERDCHTYGGGKKGGKAFILNESHGLKKAVIRYFLDFLERLPKHVVFIFTTTVDGMQLFEEGIDANPLLSRCTEMPLAQRGLAEAFAQRALEIAQAENLDGQPLEKYIRLVNEKKGNMRAVLQFIEAGGMLS